MSEPEREQLQRQVQGATPARMLRECVEVLAALTVDKPLVLMAAGPSPPEAPYYRITHPEDKDRGHGVQ